MNNVFKWLAGAGLVYGLWRLSKKAYTAQTLNIKVVGLKLSPISAASVGLNITNPNADDITFNSITTDVSINDYPLSTLNYQKTFIIKPNSSQTINLPIRINPLDGAQLLFNILQNKGKVNSISLTGSVNLEGATLPVNVKKSFANAS